jgi:hypothetical protein
VPAAGGSIASTTVGAGDETQGACDPQAGGEDVTFSWTPNTTGTATASICGTVAFDSVIYARDGSCGGSQIACGDDNPCNSQISFAVTAGNTYFIVVDGFNGTHAGGFTLTVSVL